ncbi:MAG: flp pilus-assembly TadE/G-like family protein [Rothia sp. (in: high G+C Gram-positive bacteria)]|uniref:Rv3654c family TadE-like protein n=1 Tax=Rothia sp. (in: high G+C Gram-positive bacteria) TaxID=1885016 RepID=UPI0026DFE2BD|nr:Rv3654c family TadE-like protein [Rothia sp. (in: high G+C Gram-positive bacteria)]MDO5749886.1 flp pilus-assembly TadE/G-like family protein [Rothia sp. (in: high G+C Gram-positive bacteria)]
MGTYISSLRTLISPLRALIVSFRAYLADSAPEPHNLRENREQGSGTVMALGIIAALIIASLLVAGMSAAVHAKTQAQNAADAAALAAADSLRGISSGDPCSIAREIAEANGAQLVGCAFPAREETVDVRVSKALPGPFATLGPVEAIARAGSPADPQSLDSEAEEYSEPEE